MTAIAESRGSEVKELEVMADHVRLFIGAPPTESPVGIVKALKGISARVLFDEHPILRTMFRQGHLWSPSYYIGTVGHVSAEAIARYIRDQKLRRVGRPASSPR
jgi:putative transposase